jgi:pimeloyl-ACP methyl ester carboxylesterase
MWGLRPRDGGGRAVFPGFEELEISTVGTTIRGRRGGDGPPLLLLHGIPETHLMWHDVAPALAQDFTVIATDLRGFGHSAAPASTPDHAPYSECRAAATLDVQHDEADRGRRRITCPVLALWSRSGPVGSWYEPLELWREWADDVQGDAMDAGHFLPEEAPEETVRRLRAFFSGGRPGWNL